MEKLIRGMAEAVLVASLAVTSVKAQDNSRWVGNSHIVEFGQDRISMTTICEEPKHISIEWRRRVLPVGVERAIEAHEIQRDERTLINFPVNTRPDLPDDRSESVTVNLPLGHYFIWVGQSSVERVFDCKEFRFEE